jgi:PAS domain-containing protein
MATATKDHFGAAIDMTAQRRNEAEIRAREAQFRSFADHSHYLIWTADPKQDSIIYRSAAYERIWGYPGQKRPVRWSNG